MPTVIAGLKWILSVLTSKPLGAVTLIPSVKLSPYTLNCVDGDAMPALVVTGYKVPVAVMLLGVGLTVMVKVKGPASQPSTPSAKLPKENGPPSDEIGLVTE